MMNFEQVLDQKKKDLTEALILFGEGKRVNKVLVDLEKNRPEFYEFYQSGFETGQQSKSGEVDALKRSLDARCKQLLDSEAFYDYEKQRADNLQKEVDRLNEALKYMLEQLDHPYRSCGERIEKKVNTILKKK